MTNLFCATLLGTLLLASADVGDARCATRVVAQDGSGVTESIWDAVDLSSPGDSILIQPGVYSEQRQYEISAGTFASTLLGIRISDLTLIGAHPDSVKLLDPAGLSSPKSGAYGFVASPQANGYRVSGISVAGAAEGFRLLASGSVANVQASSCHIGMTCAEANSIAIENSESHGVSVGILAFQIGVLSLQQLTVTSSSIGLGLQAVNDAQIYDVAIEKSGLAMTLQSGSTATASRLLVTPACGNGISLNDSSSLQLRRSQISAFSTSFIGAGASHLDARRSVFDTATYTGFDLSGGTTTQVNYYVGGFFGLSGPP
jgi:hypothetical protein